MTTFSSWRTRLSGRAALAAVVTIGSTSVLAGCSTSSGSCVDYAAPRPLATRIAQADLAAVVTFTDTGRTVQINAVYPVHKAHVTQILRGQKPRGKILVTVVPGDCISRCSFQLLAGETRRLQGQDLGSSAMTGADEGSTL